MAYKYFKSSWIYALSDYVVQEVPFVMVTVAKVEGSAPRESGCRMLVLNHTIIETIGGGALEEVAINLSRQMLEKNDGDNYRLELYGLGPALEQCCGGAVTLAFEKITAMPDWVNQCASAGDDAILISEFASSTVQRQIHNSELTAIDHHEVHAADVRLIERIKPLMPNAVIFGAGHVGSALVDCLIKLPFKIHWVDDRENIFNECDESLIKIHTGKPTAELIDDLPDYALNVVMTHSHQLDEDICLKYLMQKDFRFLGLIGSKTKRARFLHRFKHQGVPQDRISQLTCPIGISDITGNSPPEIAIAVAAQLLSLRDQLIADTVIL